MAKSIGMINADGWAGAARKSGFDADDWDEFTDAAKAHFEAGAKAVALHILDLMSAAGVTPAEAAAQLRAGKTIEDICAESSSYSARQICHADEAVLVPGSGPICTEPQGHEGAHVARDGSGRVVSSWASRG
jgi:hypothetical protein